MKGLGRRSASPLLFAWALLAPSFAAAAVLHVAQRGSDADPGTAERPWRTLQHAVERAAPGDTIRVHEGTYQGARIERSGRRKRPIVLEAAPGERVVLDRPGARARHGSILEIERFGGIVRDWAIRGFEIVGAPRSGIDVRGAARIAVERNRVRASGLSGIFTAFADRVRILDNESYENGEHGVYASNSGDRPRIVGNLLWDNAASGIHLNGDLSQGGDGVIARARIARNAILGNGRLGGSGINLDGVRQALVVNNLVVDEHASGISLFRQDGAICSSGNRVFHNTVVVAEDGRWALNLPDPGCANNRVVNNVLWTSHPWRGSIAVAEPRPPGFESRHNAVRDRFSVDGGETRISFEEWRGLGHGEGSFLASPEELFVDAAAGDYRLRRGGPAQDAGARLRRVRRDLVGTRRPQGAGWDVGAYEARVEATRTRGAGLDQPDLLDR